MEFDVLAKRRAHNGLVAVSSVPSRPHRSEAIQFEVQLNDALGVAGAVSAAPDGTAAPAPSSKRLACHVAVLRSILASGALGPLQRVMERITSELLRGAYSDALTVSPLGEGSGTYAGMEGIPFFEQLQDSQEAVAHLSAQLEEQRHTVAQSLAYLKERTAQEAPSRDEAEMAARIATLEGELYGLRHERDEAQRKVETAEREKMEALRAMEAEVRRWQQDAHDAKRETRLLKKKAKEQEAVRLAFAELRQPALAGQGAGALGAAGSPVAALARQLKEESDAAEAVAMESQLILLHNARITEYEAALESSPPSEVARVKADFVQEVQAMQDEMVKLSAHIRSFESRLSSSTPVEQPKAAPPAAVAPAGPDPAKQVDLEVSYDGGATFALLRAPAPLRPLPGRTPEIQAAFSLPRDATHIRVRSPPAATGGPVPAAASPTPPPLHQHRGSPQNENRPPEERGQKGPSALSRAGPDANGEASAGPSADDPLWEGYFARVASWGAAAAALAPTAAVRSRLPRTTRRRDVDLQSLLATIEAVFRAKLKSEGAPDAAGAPDRDGDDDVAEARGGTTVTGTRTSLHVFLYKWLEDKYGVRATVLLVAHGLLSAVERHAGGSAVVRLFGQVLAGKADDATWRYTMHWRRVAAAAALDSGDGFQDWLAELYPGMKDDELAGLASEYAAYTPHPSRAAAIDFLTARLLAKNEPRVKKWTKILRWKDTAHKNAFRRRDFLDIVGKLFPMLSTDEAAAQYDAAARVTGADKVAVDTLALITSCLDASLVSTSEAPHNKRHPSLVPVAVPFLPPP
ncbi:hypothetical protein KFL_007260040 [Klebsormidium nitens]|uniref:Uncharacterized protein n=1 Tax=Klebsormidium nitens TaxID=105231 RepID=A0A1Y1INN8_KLENI|nr:hypothetical protein KFL_007260040 [Klebsormidium nitens]|eukprot:GAQ91089.1 hypothetical protein KFL_007260040 [Klebsormidium nitens]